MENKIEMRNTIPIFEGYVVEHNKPNNQPDQVVVSVTHKNKKSRLLLYKNSDVNSAQAILGLAFDLPSEPIYELSDPIKS